MLVAAGANLDAAGVAAKRLADGERQVAVDKLVDRLCGGPGAIACGEQRIADLRPHRAVSKRRRERAASAPEPHRDGFATARLADCHGLSPRARFTGVCS